MVSYSRTLQVEPSRVLNLDSIVKQVEVELTRFFLKK
jgi:hypothetical protein